jgi:hypothetical protein
MGFKAREFLILISRSNFPLLKTLLSHFRDLIMLTSFRTIHFHRLALVFLLVGLAADLVPHPALGSSFLIQALQAMTQSATAAE